MDLPVEKLEKFGLEDFIDVYRFYLCSRTLSPNQIASFLQFNSDYIAIITRPPDSFSKNEKLYELTQKKSEAAKFLEALNETGNEHILEFIKKADFSTASANPNRRRGIWFNIPEPIDSFCGREDFLTQLHDQLKPRDDSETEVTILPQVKIVSGLGGIGKTEAVKKYIIKNEKFYNNFIWIDAETENSMGNSFLKLAEEISIPVKNSKGKPREIQEIVKKIYNKICDGGKSNLIVFDNAEDYQSCEKFFPFGLHPDLTKPVILATSRNQEWISPTEKIQVLPLDKITDDESLEFILKQLEIPESEILEFKEESKEFIELIGGLPLALQHSVAFIKHENELKAFTGQSYKIGDYVKEFKSRIKKLLSFPPAAGSSTTVLITWKVTLKKIKKQPKGRIATEIIELMSFLYADKIPFQLLLQLRLNDFKTILNDWVREQDAEFQMTNYLGEGLKLLEKYSMIKTTGSFVSIHRQVQFAIIQNMKWHYVDSFKSILDHLAYKCSKLLKTIKLPDDRDIFLNMLQIVDHQFDWIPAYSEISFTNKGLVLLKRLYEPSRVKCDLDIYENQGKLLVACCNMALELRQQQKYEDSLGLLQYALAHMKKVAGENDPDTLVTQNNVAVVHSDLGRFSQALVLFQIVEKKQTEVLGPHHRDILGTKQNMASVLLKLNKLEEASKIFNEVHEKRKEIFGETHSDTIDTLDWIGVTLEKQGKFTDAQQLYKKVDKIRKANLDENHPQTTMAKSSIVIVELKIKPPREGE